MALKILPPELASDPRFSERFAREARALAKLNHPNIVQCFDFGHTARQEGGKSDDDQEDHDGDYFYLLLEYVDGVNLRQAMGSGDSQREKR